MITIKGPYKWNHWSMLDS